MTRRLCRVFVASAMLFGLLWQRAPIARAVPIEGRTQLELQTVVLAFSRAKLEGDDDSRYSERSSTVGFVGRFGVAAGYAIRERIQLRVLLGLAHTSLRGDRESPGEIEETRGVALSYELTPGIRYVHPGEQVRFFASAGIGAHGYVADIARQRGFKLAGTLGLFGFLNQYVSLDPSIELSLSRVRLSEESVGVNALTVESKGNAVAVFLAVSLSVWMGGMR
jgi:hypothetical protein